MAQVMQKIWSSDQNDLWFLCIFLQFRNLFYLAVHDQLFSQLRSPLVLTFRMIAWVASTVPWLMAQKATNLGH